MPDSDVVVDLNLDHRNEVGLHPSLGYPRRLGPRNHRDQDRDGVAASKTYQLDQALVGRRVALVFDPFDMETIEVRHSGRSHGHAVAHQIIRHTHPKAKPATTAAPPPTRSGIDYFKIVTDTQH